MDSDRRPECDTVGGEQALAALAEWLAVQAPSLRHQVRNLRDAIIIAGAPPLPAPPGPPSEDAPLSH